MAIEPDKEKIIVTICPHSQVPIPYLEEEGKTSPSYNTNIVIIMHYNTLKMVLDSYWTYNSRKSGM